MNWYTEQVDGEQVGARKVFEKGGGERGGEKAYRESQRGTNCSLLIFSPSKGTSAKGGIEPCADYAI